MTPPPAAAAPAVYPGPRTRPTRPRPARPPARPHTRRAPLAPVRRPRRVSGPASAPPVAAPRRRAAARPNPVAAVVSHPLLDRLLHGRAWIGIVAFALIGIVTMQLGLLKLNAGIGRALEHEAALQRENAALSVEDSETAAGDTVELQAGHMGMQLIPEGALRFLAVRGGDEANVVERAAQALNARASAPKSSASETETTAAAPATSTETTTAGPATSTETTTPGEPAQAQAAPAATTAEPVQAQATTAETSAAEPTAATTSEATSQESQQAQG